MEAAEQTAKKIYQRYIQQTEQQLQISQGIVDIEQLYQWSLLSSKNKLLPTKIVLVT